MKTIWNSIKHIFAIIVSIITCGFVQLEDEMRKKYRIQILQTKIENFKLGNKKSFDKKVSLAQEKAVIENKIKSLESKMSNLKSDISKVGTNDKVLFSKLAKSIDDLNGEIENYYEIKKVVDKSIDIIDKGMEFVKTQISAAERQKKIIESKQEIVNIGKNVNNIMSDVYQPNSDNNTSFVDIENELDNDLIKENTKTELFKTEFEIPEISTVEYNTDEEMNEFLKKYGIVKNNEE